MSNLNATQYQEQVFGFKGTPSKPLLDFNTVPSRMTLSKLFREAHAELSNPEKMWRTTFAAIKSPIKNETKHQFFIRSISIYDLGFRDLSRFKPGQVCTLRPSGQYRNSVEFIGVVGKDGHRLYIAPKSVMHLRSGFAVKSPFEITLYETIEKDQLYYYATSGLATPFDRENGKINRNGANIVPGNGQDNYIYEFSKKIKRNKSVLQTWTNEITILVLDNYPAKDTLYPGNSY